MGSVDAEAVVTILSYCFVSALCLVVFFLVDNATGSGPWPTKRTKRTQRLVGRSKKSGIGNTGKPISASSSRSVSPAPSSVMLDTSSTSSLISDYDSSSSFHHGARMNSSLALSERLHNSKKTGVIPKACHDLGNELSEDENDKAFRRRLKKIVKLSNPPQV